ncbi:MAG: FkbM family methyltransferase [Bacteroidales bacterium]|nr:FkbM family methyltransferase [Bacteroidales bacterium]
MKYFLKKLVLLLPYRFRTKYFKKLALRYSMIEGLHHLKDMGFEPDYILDIGVADGTHAIQNAFPDSFYIWIEPLKEFEGAIRKLQKKYKGDYYCAAAGSKPGKATINIHNELTGSSLLKEEDGPASDGIQREINIITVDSLLEKYPFKDDTRIFMKLDVQGFELDVLDGATEFLKKCDAVQLEVSIFKFQKDSPDLHDVVVYMKKAGFVVYDIVDGLNRPLDNALAQKDLIFVKEEGFFRQTNKFRED